MKDDDRRAFAEVDAALRTAPVAFAPGTLAPAVMARVRALAAPKPRFVLSWLDLAVPLFATLMFALAFILWFNLPAPEVALLGAQLKWLGLLLSQQLGLLALSPATLFAGAMAVTALCALWFVIREPRFTR